VETLANAIGLRALGLGARVIDVSAPSALVRGPRQTGLKEANRCGFRTWGIRREVRKFSRSAIRTQSLAKRLSARNEQRTKELVCCESNLSIRDKMLPKRLDLPFWLQSRTLFCGAANDAKLASAPSLLAQRTSLAGPAVRQRFISRSMGPATPAASPAYLVLMTSGHFY
jgi:hypothetical protein